MVKKVSSYSSIRQAARHNLQSLQNSNYSRMNKKEDLLIFSLFICIFARNNKCHHETEGTDFGLATGNEQGHL